MYPEDGDWQTACNYTTAELGGKERATMQLTHHQLKLKAAILISIMMLALSAAYVGASPTPAGQQASRWATPSYYLGPVTNIGGTDTDAQPSIAAAGNPLAAAFITRRWGQPSQVAYTQSSDGGATWQAATQVSHGTGSANVTAGPFIEVSAAGTHILWSASPSSGGALELWFASSASGWQPTHPVAPTFFSAVAASLAPLPDGQLRAIYFAGSTLTPNVITGTATGGTWAQPTELSNIGYGGHGADVYNSGSDSYLAYSDIVGDGTKVRVVALRGGQVEADIASGNITGAYNPSITLAGATLYASFCGWQGSGGEAHRDVYMTSRNAAQPGTWAAPQRFAQLPSGQSCDETSLALDPATNSPLLLYNVETAGSGFGSSTLYLAALPSGTPTPILSYGGQVRLAAARIVATSSGLGLSLGYTDFAPTTPLRRALYAPLIADGAATPTPPPATPTPAPQPSPTGHPCTNPFVDIGGTPYYYEIVTLYCQGVVSGIDPTHYGPALPSNRGQFVKMLMLAFGIPQSTATIPHFDDVNPGHWAYGYVQGAWQAGLVSGYDISWCQAHGYLYPCFGAGINLTRAQLATLIVSATGLDLFHPRDPTFEDVPANHWAYLPIETANYYGLIEPVGGGQFAPNLSAFRDGLAHTLWTAQHLPLDKMPKIKRAREQP